MSNNESRFTTHLLILVCGLALIFLAHTSFMENVQPTISKTLEAIGFGLAGYAPIEIIMSIPIRLKEYSTKRNVDKLFRSTVKIISLKKVLPPFFAIDVEGCLTPPQRSEIELRKFQRLRAYCEFVRENHERQYPPIVIYSGRSQGYVELLAQTLGMINPSFELPFVIENGAALYYPASRKTLPMLTKEQRSSIEATYNLLSQNLPENEFEPKSYMITINAIPTRQTIDELREKVTLVLQANNLLKLFTITAAASAVDINIKDYNKLSGLIKVLDEYRNLRPEAKSCSLKDIVALAHSTSDLAVIENVGKAFCPTYDVHPEVRLVVENRFGSDNVIDEKHIEFVIQVIERTCGLRLL